MELTPAAAYQWRPSRGRAAPAATVGRSRLAEPKRWRLGCVEGSAATVRAAQAENWCLHSQQVRTLSKAVAATTEGEAVIAATIRPRVWGAVGEEVVAAEGVSGDTDLTSPGELDLLNV